MAVGLLLSDLYEHKDAGEALRYHKLAMAANDKIYDVQKTTQLLNAQFNEQLQQQQADAYKVNLQNKTRTSILLIALGFFLLVVVLLYRYNQHKQKAKVQIE